MRAQSSSSFMPIVVNVEEPFQQFQEFRESFDEPFDLDSECDAYVRDVAQFTLQRLRQHLDHAEQGEISFVDPDDADKAA